MYCCAASRAAAKITSLGSNLFTSWSPDEKYIAIGNKHDNVMVFDAASTKQLKKVKFGYEVNELAWSANSDHLLVATGGGEMGSVDIVSFQNNDLQLIESVAAHTSNCLCLKIDSNYRRMAVGSADYMLSLWDLNDLVCHHMVFCE
jgi:THO complex subunit 3